tara:strand:- start:57 stop:935 length:879 start_codon:yes stop_codon:yes gene_type:complete
MNYTSIYLTSGGTNGYVLIGALQVLERSNLLSNIKTVIGCSIGSVFSLFFILGYKSKDIFKILSSHNVEDIYFNRPINNDNLILNLTAELGINDGTGLIRILQIFLEQKGLSLNTTFKQLYEKTNKELIILASNIIDNKLEILSHIKHPNMSVSLAIKASSAIPLVFTPVNYNNKILVDGGFLSDTNCESIKEDTLILRLKSEQYYDVENVIDNIYDYVKLLFQNLLLLTQVYNDNINNTIEFNLKNTGINFDLTKDTKNDLYYYGISLTIDFIIKRKLKLKYFNKFRNLKI